MEADDGTFFPEDPNQRLAIEKGGVGVPGLTGSEGRR